MQYIYIYYICIYIIVTDEEHKKGGAQSMGEKEGNNETGGKDQVFADKQLVRTGNTVVVGSHACFFVCDV